MQTKWGRLPLNGNVIMTELLLTGEELEIPMPIFPPGNSSVRLALPKKPRLHSWTLKFSKRPTHQEPMAKSHGLRILPQTCPIQEGSPWKHHASSSFSPEECSWVPVSRGRFQSLLFLNLCSKFLLCSNICLKSLLNRSNLCSVDFFLYKFFPLLNSNFCWRV